MAEAMGFGALTLVTLRSFSVAARGGMEFEGARIGDGGK